MEKQRQRCIDRQHANVYLSFICTFLYSDANHNSTPICFQSPLYTHEFDTVCRCFNGQRRFYKAGTAKCDYDYAVWLFISTDTKQNRKTWQNRLGIELLQPLIDGFRSADITDLITNTIGGIVGYGFYVLFRHVTFFILDYLKKRN